MSSAGSRPRDERGAIAIVVALLSMVLFVTAALAVDMGNLWSRERDLQKQVDIAALSAGYLLPQTAENRTEIAEEVATYLRSNSTVGQVANITGAQLLNGVRTDGEVTFQDDDGDPCTADCTSMKVEAPIAQVDFSFARIIGVDEAEVARDATVRVMGALPPAHDMLPFWLPSGCALGPSQADTAGGNAPAPPLPSSPTISPTSSPTSSPTGSTSPTATSSPTASPTPSPPGLPVGPHVLNGPSPVTVAQGTTRTMTGLTITNHSSNIDRATIRFYSPDGLWFIDYAAQSLKKAASVLMVPNFQVGSEVTGHPGEWRVHALVERNKINQISSNHLLFHVTGPPAPPAPPAPTGTSSPTSSPTSETTSAAPTSVPVGCIGQDRGNFGQLDSPRKGMSGQTNARLALNLAEGLDHQLVPFVFAPGQVPTKECGSSNKGYIPGAKPDDVSEDGRNCIQGQTGNAGPGIYDGLIAGTGVYPGRLSVDRPGNSTSPLCSGRANMSIGDSTINNDVLSCFLRDKPDGSPYTLEDIAQSDNVTEAMLDPAVMDSPRMVWLPVVFATDRAQKGFQPILDFVPAFITDETQTALATTSNGVTINGNSVKTINVFCFNKDALPVPSRSPTVTYTGPGLRSIVRLIN